MADTEGAMEALARQGQALAASAANMASTGALAAAGTSGSSGATGTGTTGTGITGTGTGSQTGLAWPKVELSGSAPNYLSKQARGKAGVLAC